MLMLLMLPSHQCLHLDWTDYCHTVLPTAAVAGAAPSATVASPTAPTAVATAYNGGMEEDAADEEYDPANALM